MSTCMVREWRDSGGCRALTPGLSTPAGFREIVEGGDEVVNVNIDLQRGGFGAAIGMYGKKLDGSNQVSFFNGRVVFSDDS